jgi:hypothetical protein
LPFFTEEEIARVSGSWKDTTQFRPVQHSAGGQVVPIPWDIGFQCPFFDPKTHHCCIYRERPLDCQLYPYALMLDPASSGVWLGIDTKCPATDTPGLMERLVTGAGRIWETAMSSGFIELVEKAPRLIGPYQPDVLPLFRLEALTAALISAKKLIPWRTPCDAFPDSSPHERMVPSAYPIEATHPLTLADRPVVEGYLRQMKPRLASQTFALQFMAGDLISLRWSVVEGFLCLWAFDHGTVYMALPPMGPGDCRQILPQCFAFMDQYNASPGISRIENLSLSDIRKERLLEFQIRPGYPDYLYRREDLVDLQGRSFRGKRSDCRAFAKNTDIEYRPYQPSHASAALALFHRWQTDRMEKTADPLARKLLEDARSFHHRALREGEAMGLIGRVLSVGEDMAAYTFGAPLNDETFVVALEVTDPAYRGASAYVFREFSRELGGYTTINVMDDSGLPGLRRLKRSYRPWRLEPSFVLQRR